MDISEVQIVLDDQKQPTRNISSGTKNLWLMGRRGSVRTKCLTNAVVRVLLGPVACALAVQNDLMVYLAPM